MTGGAADLVADLRRLQGRARSVGAALGRAQRLLPESGRGRDGSGVVEVTIGADQLPVAVRVAPDWERRLDPGELDAAVVTACRAAVADRLTTWADQLVEQHAMPSRSRPDVRAAAPPPGPSRPDGPTTDPAGRAGSAAREPVGVAPDGARLEAAVAELQEQLSAAFAARPRTGAGDATAGDRAAPPAPAVPAGVVAGYGAGGRVEVTVCPGGVTGCRADPVWVRAQSAAALATALQEAVADARARLTAPAARSGPHGRQVSPGRADRDGVDLDGLAAGALELVARAARVAGGGPR